MTLSYALYVQQLPAGTDRVLVLGSLAGNRQGTGWFRPSDVTALFEELRVPQPANVSQALSQLRSRGLVLRRASGGAWSLTPLGRQEVLGLMGELQEKGAGPDLASPGGAELGHGLHALIPPFFAPLTWSKPIQHFLKQYRFDENVFCMTRFPIAANQLDPVGGVISTIRDTLGTHGLTLHLASDRNIVDDLWGNVAAHGWACRYGIGLFENRLARGLNHNLVAEIGAMLMTGRRCALVKDKTQESLPTDFGGHLYKEVDFDDSETVRIAIEHWIVHDLGLS